MTRDSTYASDHVSDLGGLLLSEGKHQIDLGSPDHQMNIILPLDVNVVRG